MTQEESDKYLEQLKKESEGVIKLSILIPTIKSRRFMFNNLYQELYRQLDMGGFRGKGEEKWEVLIPVMKDGEQMLAENGSPIYRPATQIFKHPDKIEIVFNSDDHKLIGQKRNELLEKAKGEYVCFFDDDDFPANDYIKLIMEALESSPDCLSLKGVMTTNAQKPEIFEHSINYSEWKTTSKEVKYERYVNHLNVIKASIAKQFKFPDKNFGEDHDWSKQLQASGLLKTEVRIDRILYNYRFISDKKVA